jgi:hypothetical protein
MRLGLFGDGRRVFSRLNRPRRSPVAGSPAGTVCLSGTGHPDSSTPESWQKLAGGRSKSKTSGGGSADLGILQGVPEFCDPCGVDGRFGTAIRWCRCAQPPANFWQAAGLRPKAASL